jgi:hypothetical protein
MVSAADVTPEWELADAKTKPSPDPRMRKVVFVE